MYIDTHAHLDFPELLPHIEAVLANAKRAQVSSILTVGIEAHTNQNVLDLARQHAEVFAAIGWHPHEADQAGEKLEPLIREMAAAPKVKAIGEIGLDYYRQHSEPDKQREVFKRMLDLAQELNLPIIVHCREAFPDTLEILQNENRGNLRGVFHCFSGGENELKQILDLDFFVSYTGNITYPNTRLLSIVKATPVDRLLLETDCPFMTPHPHRGKRNEPANIPLIAKQIAEVKKLSVEDIARITRYNTYRLFGIGEAPQPSFVYPIRNSLYVALTSRCTNSCRFCPRNILPIVKGHYIGIPETAEPSFAQVISALSEVGKHDEVVFCGFGEPTLRFEVLIQVARWLKAQGVRCIRLDTNGQGNLINGRNIVPEMVGLIDAVSISLNEHRSDLYQALVQSDFGEPAFQAVLDFARHCVQSLPDVTLSVVSYPGVSIAASQALAEVIGAKFRVREYNEVG